MTETAEEIGRLLVDVIEELPSKATITVSGIAGERFGQTTYVQTEAKLRNRVYERYTGHGPTLTAALTELRDILRIPQGDA